MKNINLDAEESIVKKKEKKMLKIKEKIQTCKVCVQLGRSGQLTDIYQFLHRNEVLDSSQYRTQASSLLCISKRKYQNKIQNLLFNLISKHDCCAKNKIKFIVLKIEI